MQRNQAYFIEKGYPARFRGFPPADADIDKERVRLGKLYRYQSQLAAEGRDPSSGVALYAKHEADSEDLEDDLDDDDEPPRRPVVARSRKTTKKTTKRAPKRGIRPKASTKVKNDFAMVPRAVLDADTTVGAKTVYAVLALYADYKTHETFVGQETMAKLLHVSTRSVRRWTDELVVAGLIEIRARGRSNLYKVVR